MRTIEQLCGDIALTAEEGEKKLDVSPSDVGYIVAEFIKGFVSGSSGQLPPAFVNELFEIAEAARKTKDEI